MARAEVHVKLTEVGEVKELLAAATERIRRAEAAISSVRALLEERRAGKFWYVRVADVQAVLDSSETPPAAPEPTDIDQANLLSLVEDEFYRFQHEEGWRQRGWDFADGLVRILGESGWTLGPPKRPEPMFKPGWLRDQVDKAVASYNELPPSLRTTPAAPVPEERSDEKKFVECQLPVGWEWCALRIGHAGQCDSRPSAEEGRAANALTRPPVGSDEAPKKPVAARSPWHDCPVCGNWPCDEHREES